MRQSLKISMSFLVSLIIAFLFLLFGASGFFTIIETNFYIPKIQIHYEGLLQGIVDETERNIKDNIDRFEAILDNSFIPSAFLSDQRKSVSDIKAREKEFAKAKEKYPDLLYIRFLGPNGKKLHYSTLETDFKSSKADQRVYYNYDQVEKDIDATTVICLKDDLPKVTLNGKNNLLVYSFPIVDSYDVFKGTALFYISKNDIARSLLASPELEIKDDIILIEDKGILFNFPQEKVSLIQEEVQRIWEKNTENKSFSDTIIASLNEEKVTFTLLTRKTKYSANLSLLLSGKFFEIPQFYKIVMLILLFFTLFIIIYLLFNIRQDPILVISRRIKYLQIQFLKQFIDAQEEIDWKKWHKHLLVHGSRVKSSIKKGIGRINKDKEKVVDELLNKSWKSIINIIGRKTEQEKPVSFDVKKIEEIITRALKRGNIVIPVQKAHLAGDMKVDQPEKTQENEVIEALEVLEQEDHITGKEAEEGGLETLEEVEEAEEGELETLEEVGEAAAEAEEEGEIEALEEVGEEEGEIEALEVVEETEESELEALEEVGEAEEAGEIEALEEVEEVEEAGEIEALEEVEEAAEIEDLEEAGEILEVEEVEEVEDLESPEEIQEAEEVKKEDMVIIASSDKKEKTTEVQEGEGTLDYLFKKKSVDIFQALPPEPFEQLEELQLAANPDEYTYFERGGKYYLLRKERLKKGGKNGTEKQDQSDSIILFEPLKKTIEETQKIVIPASGDEPKYKTEEAEYYALVSKNQIKFYTLEEVFSIMKESDKNIIIENGVYKINKDIMQANLKPKDTKLKELVDSVKDGIETKGEENENYKPGIIDDNENEKKCVSFTLSKGLDYDSYIDNFEDKDNLTIMKSLVEFSKNINAYIVGIFTFKNDEHVIDISVGLQEKSRELFKFSKDEIYSIEIFSKRKVCILYTAPRDIQFLRERLDDFDKKYINSMLFMPAKFKQTDVFFIFGFSNKIKGSIKDIFSNLKLKFVS